MVINNFTLEEVRNFWDKVAEIYDETNKKIGPAHFQRFTEALKLLSLRDNDKVLNIWSRTGNALPYLKQIGQIEIYNMEVSDKMIGIAKNKFPTEKFTLTDLAILNFPNNHFDAILSLETLEHTPNPEQLVKEFYRVLKPGGILVMSLPPATAELPLKIYHLFFKNHGEGPHKFLSSKTVKRMLRKIGFELISHQGTLLIPVGPRILQNLGEKIMEKLQKTFLKEFGIRQFYVCKK